MGGMENFKSLWWGMGRKRLGNTGLSRLKAVEDRQMKLQKDQTLKPGYFISKARLYDWQHASVKNISPKIGLTAGN